MTRLRSTCRNAPAALLQSCLCALTPSPLALQTFLLEKSRVVSTTAKGERNYHVFYHVLKGAGLLGSDDPEQQRLLNRSQCTTIPRVDDLEEYHGECSGAFDPVGLLACWLLAAGCWLLAAGCWLMAGGW